MSASLVIRRVCNCPVGSVDPTEGDPRSRASVRADPPKAHPLDAALGFEPDPAGDSATTELDRVIDPAALHRASPVGGRLLALGLGNHAGGTNARSTLIPAVLRALAR